MPIPAKDKPTSQLRQEVIDQLVLNYGHGKISKGAFERRLDQAYDTDEHETLVSLAADLETFEDPNYDARRDNILYADETLAEDSDLMVNIFSGTHKDNEEIVPASLKILNIFGGSHVDYSMAQFSSPETHIKILCIFGGAHVFVPEGVRVKTRVIPFMGGTRNTSESGNDPHAPVVIVSGLALCSGVHIGVKRTFRERIQSFADDIKEMLS